MHRLHFRGKVSKFKRSQVYSRGGYTLPNLNVGHRVPQNTLVGPIWRSCGQKTRPHGHFWVPFRPNLVFGFYQRNGRIKIVSRLALWGVYPEVLRAEQQKSTLFSMLLSPFWRKLSKTVKKSWKLCPFFQTRIQYWFYPLCFCNHWNR